MKASFEQFRNSLSDLRSHLTAKTLEEEILAASTTIGRPSMCRNLIKKYGEHVATYFAQRKQFDYTSIIVSLYGFFERYIEAIITAYINHLNRIVPQYRSLPQEICQQHVALSFKLIERAKIIGRDSEFPDSMIVANLNSCLQEDPRYVMNSSAFAQHSTNLRVSMLEHMFAQIGINNISEKLILNKYFQSYLDSIYPDKDPLRKKKEVALSRIDELAERRNEVSHGSPSETLSDDILLDFITFFEHFGLSIFQVMNEEAFPFEAIHSGVNLGSPIKIINRKIVCISISNLTISVGDLLIAYNPRAKKQYLGSEIQELQVDNVVHQQIEATTATNIGVRLSFNAKMNHQFYLVKKR